MPIYIRLGFKSDKVRMYSLLFGKVYWDLNPLNNSRVEMEKEPESMGTHLSPPLLWRRKPVLIRVGFEFGLSPFFKVGGEGGERDADTCSKPPSIYVVNFV